MNISSDPFPFFMMRHRGYWEVDIQSNLNKGNLTKGKPATWLIIVCSVIAAIVLAGVVVLMLLGRSVRAGKYTSTEDETQAIQEILQYPKEKQQQYLTGSEDNVLISAIEDGSIAAAAELYAVSYVIEDSASRLLTESELLSQYTYGELYYAYYELFARHHVIFGEEVVDAYFAGKRWYTGNVTAEEFAKSDDRFNDYEVANKEAILQAFKVLYELKQNGGGQ